LATHDTAEWASLVINIGKFCYFRAAAIPYTSCQVFPFVHQPTPRIYRRTSDKFSNFTPDAPLSANAVQNVLLAQSGLELVSRLKKKQKILQGNHLA
jgi:hypothetical protein